MIRKLILTASLLLSLLNSYGQDSTECEFNDLYLGFLYTGNESMANIDWTILRNDTVFDQGTSLNSDLYIPICLPDDCYTLVLDLSENKVPGFVCIIDNGTYVFFLPIEDGDTMTIDFSIDIEDCSSLGCTDPEAINFNPSATVDDGSCVYPPPCESNPVLLSFTYGGFNLSSPIEWLLTSETDTIAVGNYIGSVDPYNLCLPDGCYTFSLSGLTEEVINYDYEIFHADSATVFLEGVIASTDSISVNFAVNSEDCPIEGCTDPEAENYNPDANVDDGSCICDETAFLFFPNQGDTVQWQLTQGDSIVYDGFSLNSVVTTLCLPFDCYELQITDPPGGGNGGIAFIYPPGVPFIEIEFEDGEVTVMNLPVNADCTEGCTDPEALNFDPEATLDDGSCIYPSTCSISFEVLTDSLHPNTLFIIPSDSISNADIALWDFGDGNTLLNSFPEHEYQSNGPFILCLTTFFSGPDSTTCEATFCAEISTSMLPESSGSSGFFINILPDETSIGIEEILIIEALRIFPNPAENQIHLELNSMRTSQVEITIYDTKGRSLAVKSLIAKKGGNDFPIDISHLSSGIYNVAIRSQHSILRKKFVKE